MPTATEDRTLQVGDRVRYTGALTPRLYGETATIQADEYGGQWRVNWDNDIPNSPPTIIDETRLTKLDEPHSNARLQDGDRVRYRATASTRTPEYEGHTGVIVPRNRPTHSTTSLSIHWDEPAPVPRHPSGVTNGVSHGVLRENLTKIDDEPRPFQVGDVVNVISGPYAQRRDERIESIQDDGAAIFIESDRGTALVRPDEIRLVEQAQQPAPEAGPGSWVEITRAPDGYPPSLIGRRFEVRRMGDHSVPPGTVVLRETGLGLPSILRPDEYVVLNEGDEQQPTEEPRTPQVGDRVRLLHTTGLGSRASAGDLGEIAEVERSILLMRFDSGYTNGGDTGWWVAHDQVEVVDERPPSFQVGARVRITHSFSSARVHVGDLGTIAREHGAFWLVHLDSGVTNGVTDGWYVDENQMELVTDEPEQDWNPENLRAGDRFILQRQSDGYEYGIPSRLLGQTFTVREDERTGAGSLRAADPDGVHWAVPLDMAAPPTDAPAPTQSETAGVSATIDIEFVLHNACTAEPTDILHYLRQHVESAQRDADAGNHIQKVDRRSISVIHSERPEPAYECEHCGCRRIEAIVDVVFDFTQSASSVIDLEYDEGAFPSIEVEPDFDLAELEVQDIGFECAECGRPVHRDTLREHDIDPDVEVY